MKAIRLNHILVRRKDVLEVQDTGIYKRITIKMNNQGVIIRDTVQGSEIGTKRQFFVKKGQLVISKIDARNGAVGILPEECDNAIITGNFWAFDINTESLDSLYFNYLTSTPLFIDFFIKASDGTTNRRYLDESKFLAMEIPLPPLEEQRRIVARIEDLAGAIEEARGLRARSIEESNTLLSAALNHIFDKSSHQPTTLLKVVAEINRGKFTHRPRNEPRFYGGNIPFIQIGDISNSKKYIREYSQTLNEEGLKVSRIFSIGTIVIAITGATIGATGILTFDSCFPDSIVGITSKSDKVMTEYIYWALEYVKKGMLLDATQTTQPNINLQHFAKLTIVVPSLPEQRRIVAYLDDLQAKVDALKRLQAQTAAELDALLPSILDKAFKGEL